MNYSKDHEAVIERLNRAVEIIEHSPEVVPLIPEVRTNIAFALPDAKTPNDVAAVDGRITVVNNLPKAAGPVRFGASDHLARLIIELRKYDRQIRSALNFRYNEKIHQFVAEWARQRGKKIGIIDRTKEPSEIIGKDRMSAPWKVQAILSSTNGVVPEIVYETKGWGKEPMFLFTGRDPVALAEQLMKIARDFVQTAQSSI